MKNIVEENDMPKVKNKLWIWGHAANVHYNRYGIGKTSRMTPAEGLGATRGRISLDYFELPKIRIDFIDWRSMCTR